MDKHPGFVPSDWYPLLTSTLATFPYFMGLTWSLALYGTFACQVITYLNAFSNDKASLRLLVLYIFVVETALTSYDTWNIGDHFVHPRRDDLGNLFIVHGTYYELIKIHTMLTAFILTPVQLFYAWRLRSLQASKVLTYLIYGCSLSSLVSSIVTALIAPRGIPPLVDGLSRVGILVQSQASLLAPTLIWLGSSAIADLLVTGGTSYILFRSKTGFQQTDSNLAKIIRLTLETGLLTSTCILMEIILFLLQQDGIIGGYKGINYDDSAFYIIPNLILSKMYANMLLATLNSRTQWRSSTKLVSTTFCREEMEGNAYALQKM